MIDFEKLQGDVVRLEKLLPAVKKADPAAMKDMVVGLRDILSSLLKDRKDPIRAGQIFKDAAAKNLIPGDTAPRGDALTIRWGGSVSPQDPQKIKEDAEKLFTLAETTLPVLKAYRKEK